MEKVHDKLLVWGSEVDYQAREQASRASRLPFVPGHVALMADAHVGLGATVGSVRAEPGRLPGAGARVRRGARPAGLDPEAAAAAGEHAPLRRRAVRGA